MVTAAITIKLLVRRRAPDGGWFTDLPRSAGTLSLIGTMFAVMLAFVILFALQSYQRARNGSSVEAIAVAELDSIAEVFQPPAGDRLHDGLVCYARAVVEDEWPAMRDGRSSDLVQSWIDKVGHEFAIAEPHGVREETAYAQWFDEQAQRREGRRERLAEASPQVPLPLWFVLCIGASLTLAYMAAQADRREGVLVQSIPIGFFSAMVTAARSWSLPRPSVHKRDRRHCAHRNAADTHAHRQRERWDVRRTRRLPMFLEPCSFRRRGPGNDLRPRDESLNGVDDACGRSRRLTLTTFNVCSTPTAGSLFPRDRAAVGPRYAGRHGVSRNH
jgi:hypothetical protein